MRTELLTGPAPADLHPEIAREADEQVRIRRRLREDGYRANGEQSFRSPSSFGCAPGGPHLTALHEQAALSWMRQTTQELSLVPTRCGYVYYDVGDFVGFHTDSHYCVYTILWAMTESNEPLFYFPAYAGTRVRGLLDVARAAGGYPDGGDRVHLGTHVFVAIRGALVPHCRPPVSQPLVLATLCYSHIVGPS